MRLSWRLVLALVLLVLGTAGLSFVATGRVVLAPLSNAVFDAYVDQAVYVAEQVEAGADPRDVGRRMGLRVELRDHPPPPRPPRDHRGRRPPLQTLERDGHEVRYLPGPRDHVHVELSDGHWLFVHRAIDLDAPNEKLGAWLLGVVGLLGLVGIWAVRATLRPLDTATQAMRRVADGDLDHRIPSDGPPEVQEVAAAFHTMTERLKNLLAADRQLLAGVSHELRTPLSRLRLRMELLRDELGGHPRLDQMEADVAAIDQLVGELLELSRLQLGGVPLTPAPYSLATLTDAALATSDLPRERVHIEGAPSTVEVDHDLTVRALGNLLQNVHRYAPEGPVTIAFDDRAVSVLDRGPGVPDDRLGQLTQPFVRVDDSRATHTGGLGLGLMIVQQVMQLHGGELVLANRDGGGFTATLRFPPAPPSP